MSILVFEVMSLKEKKLSFGKPLEKNSDSKEEFGQKGNPKCLYSSKRKPKG